MLLSLLIKIVILLTKIAAAQSVAALSYHRVRGLYLLAGIFVTTVINLESLLLFLLTALEYWHEYVVKVIVRQSSFSKHAAPQSSSVNLLKR